MPIFPWRGWDGGFRELKAKNEELRGFPLTAFGTLALLTKANRFDLWILDLDLVSRSNSLKLYQLFIHTTVLNEGLMVPALHNMAGINDEDFICMSHRG